MDGARRHRSHPAWALESRAKDRDADFPRSVSLVLKDHFIVVHADIFNRRNERAKVFDVTRLERVDGIWTVLDLVVANERDKTRTELTTTSIRYNVGLTEDDFTRRQLEQGARDERLARRPHLPLPLSALRASSSSAFVALAPQINFTEIDNDISDVDLEGRSRLPDLRAVPRRVRRPAHAAHRARSRDRLFTPESLEFIRQVTDDIERVETRRARPEPRHRQHRRAACRPTPDDDGGIEVQPLLDERSTTPAAANASAGGRSTTRCCAAISCRRTARSPRSSSPSTRTASTTSAAGVIERDPPARSTRGCRPACAPYYNGSLEISETYNRVTLDEHAATLTPPILLLTIGAHLS